MALDSSLPRPSNVVPFWVWYGFWVRTLIRIPKKGTTLEGLAYRLLLGGGSTEGTVGKRVSRSSRRSASCVHPWSL